MEWRGGRNSDVMSGTNAPAQVTTTGELHVIYHFLLHSVTIYLYDSLKNFLVLICRRDQSSYSNWDTWCVNLS